MDPVFINQTVNEVVTGGLILEHSSPLFRDMSMTAVVEYILAGKASEEVLSNATKALGKNVTEFAHVLDNVLKDQKHGGTFGNTLYITGVALSVFTSVTVVLRLLSRRLLGLALKIDDYLIIFSLILSLIFASLMQHSTLYGGGTHIWDVSFNDVFWVTRCLFICEFLYTGGIIAVKTSLLIFFYRLSPQRSYRIAVICVSVFFGLMSAGLLFAMAFQCKPIAWYKDVIGRQCFDEFAFWTAFGALCIASDVIILFLPVPVVWSLQLRTKDKIAVTALFSLGAVVCVASGIRLTVLQGFVKSVDFTSREGAFSLWCLVELNVAIICANAPALKGLYTQIVSPKDKGSSAYYGQRSRTKNSKIVNTFNSSGAADRSMNTYSHRGDFDDFIPLGDRNGSRSGSRPSDVETVRSADQKEAGKPRANVLQVPGYAGDGRESASTLGDDIEAQKTAEDIAFKGLSPRHLN